MNNHYSHLMEFVFTVGHIEVYKEKKREAYYWRFFDENQFHGAFMSLQTCMSNYENVLFSQQGMADALKSTQTLTEANEASTQTFTKVCPVIKNNSPNVIFVDFYNRRRSV